MFFPDGQTPSIGDVLVQQDLGRTFRRLIEVERDNASQGRESALQATRDFFYQGEIADEMVRFCQEQGGLLAMEDLAEFQAKLEPPAIGSYKGIDVYTCGTWCQGPVSIQALHILEEFDLRGMGHNTPQYLHTLLEALKLAFADYYKKGFNKVNGIQCVLGSKDWGIMMNLKRVVFGNKANVPSSYYILNNGIIPIG